LDYFLYVRNGQGFSRVPEGLRRLLGELEKVMDLDLHPGRALAQADVQEVMRQIDSQGYFLQMPPTRGNAPLES
jgi:uncharacterized protein YcgL (UPF0745 family)